MDELASRFLGHTPITYDQVTGTGRARVPFARVPLPRATEYAAEDADVTLRLWRRFKPRLPIEGSTRDNAQAFQKYAMMVGKMTSPATKSHELTETCPRFTSLSA